MAANTPSVVCAVLFVGYGAQKRASLVQHGCPKVSMMKLVRVSIVAALIATPTLGAAEDKPDGGEHHWPRPEAIAACKDKSEGNACEFDAPRGHVAGTCRKVPSGDLVCVHPHHHHEGSAGN